jgi:hypothetical protein
LRRSSRDTVEGPGPAVSDLPDAQPGLAQAGDLDLLVLQQELIADLAHYQRSSAGTNPITSAALAGLENLCDRSR